jgi:ABC-type nitrate/sulfonate/bicarbonate transport system permease component
MRVRLRRSAAQALPAAALIVGLLALWEVLALALDIQDWLLPAPSTVWRAGIASAGLLWPHVARTLLETLLGFAAALALGLGLGIALDLSPLLRRALYPLLVASQTVPTIAIAPLLVIWFGYGLLPKIIVVGLVCFFPVVVNTADGLRSASGDLLALLRTMGASRSDLFFKVRLPSALPMIFTGIKVAITYSVVGAILGEWVGASRGLGIFMLRATNSFRTDWVFVSIFISAVLSLGLFGLVNLVERLLQPWRFGRQEHWEEL